ncbi:hypothetical protein ACLBX9_14665 [Methylobacterium sp. A49B]
MTLPFDVQPLTDGHGRVGQQQPKPVAPGPAQGPDDDNATLSECDAILVFSRTKPSNLSTRWRNRQRILRTGVRSRTVPLSDSSKTLSGAKLQAPWEGNTMRYEIKMPAWLKRRGYSSPVKARIGRSKAGRPDLVQIDPDRRTELACDGKAIQLQQYLIWRMTRID